MQRIMTKIDSVKLIWVCIVFCVATLGFGAHCVAEKIQVQPQKHSQMRNTLLEWSKTLTMEIAVEDRSGWSLVAANSPEIFIAACSTKVN
jgi:hypothetical protein